MRVILHIGANKTGTTAIQHYFHSNRKRLSRHGILWPTTGARGHAHYDLSNWLGFGHGPSSALDFEQLDEARSKIRSEIAGTSPSVVVLSSEIFMLRRSFERAIYFFDGFDLEIYACLRRHDEWWPSLWSQAIKTVEKPRWGRDFESFLQFQKTRRHQYIGYRELIESWNGAFPNRVRVIPYEYPRMPEGILPLFLNAIGCAPLLHHIPATSTKINISPRIDALSLIDFLRRCENIETKQRDELISKTLKHGGLGMKISDFLSGRLKRSLVEENADDYAFLASNFTIASDSDTFFESALPQRNGHDGPHNLPEVSAIELLLKQIS